MKQLRYFVWNYPEENHKEFEVDGITFPRDTPACVDMLFGSEYFEVNFPYPTPIPGQDNYFEIYLDYVAADVGRLFSEEWLRSQRDIEWDVVYDD